MSAPPPSAPPSAPTPEPLPPPAADADASRALLGLADAVAAAAAELGLADLGERARRDAHRRLVDQRLRAVVIGEIKHGKSSLINALVGHACLPVGVTPTTGAVVQVATGDAPGTYVRPAGGDERRDPVDAAQFAALARGDAPPASAAGVPEVIVPEGTWHAAIELIDTPGINDVDRFHAAVARGELPRADVLVLVLDGTAMLNRSELGLLRDAVAAVGGLDDSGAHVLVVVNRIDLVEPREHDALRAHLASALERTFGGFAARIEVFLTDARGALRAPDSDTLGVRELARLRERIGQIAHSRAGLTLPRARAGLRRHVTLLRAHAAIVARALSLETAALRRELDEVRRALDGSTLDLEQLRAAIDEGRARIVGDSRRRIRSFRDQVEHSARAVVEYASLKTLTGHLTGSIHDAFVGFAREEADRLRDELDGLTRQVLHTHGEHARRRLAQATLNLGFRGTPVYLDPPAVALEAGLVVVGVAGTAVMYFGNLIAGMVMTIAGPLATVMLRERSLREARVRARALLPEALDRGTQALEGSITRVIEEHARALDEHVVLANQALGQQLEAVLTRAQAWLEGAEAATATDEPRSGDEREAARAARTRRVATQRRHALAALAGTESKLEQIAAALASGDDAAHP